MQQKQASGWKIYRQGGVKKTIKWYKKTGNGVEKDRQKGGSIKRQARGKGLQQRQAKRWCKIKGKGEEKDRQGAKKTGKRVQKRQGWVERKTGKWVQEVQMQEVQTRGRKETEGVIKKKGKGE